MKFMRCKVAGFKTYYHRHLVARHHVAAARQARLHIYTGQSRVELPMRTLRL